MSLEDFLRAWVPLLMSITALATAGWNILTGPAAKNAVALKSTAETLGLLIDKLDGRMDLAEKALAAQAIKLEQVPDSESLHMVQMALERMNSDVRVMGETLKGVKETSNLMRDWLVKEGSGK